jgi:hypothetical protein
MVIIYVGKEQVNDQFFQIIDKNKDEKVDFYEFKSFFLGRSGNIEDLLNTLRRVVLMSKIDVYQKMKLFS